MKGLLKIKRCTLVRMAHWPCNNHTLQIKYEAGARRPQVSGPAKTRLTPKYEGLLAKGALWSGRLPSSGALYLLAHKCFTAGRRIAETCGKIAKKSHFSSFFYSPMCPSTIMSTELDFF